MMKIKFTSLEICSFESKNISFCIEKITKGIGEFTRGIDLRTYSSSKRNFELVDLDEPNYVDQNEHLSSISATGSKVSIFLTIIEDVGVP